MGWRSWARTQAWKAKVQVQAKAAGGSLDIEIDPTARVSPGVAVEVRRGCHARVRVGPRSRLHDGVFLHLGNASVEIGADCDVRRWVVLNVAGDLRLEGSNILGHGATVHCEHAVVFEPQASCSEYVTVTDSRHFHRDDESWFYGNSESAPVRIGRNTWLASKATVLMGAQVGEQSVVGCHAAVRGTTPPRSLLVGSPARAVRGSIEAPSS